ncbi:MAG: phosphotransferase [Clostridia bacterium]|nr:phosphotransferase [Clostridia bacterium]
MLEFTEKIAIDKGWSGDRKYRVTATDGTPYLLRVSPAESYEKKQEEFRVMTAVFALGVPMCAPVAIETDGREVLTLHTWIAGRDAADCIAEFPAEEQYTYGYRAGELLSKIHTLPAPEGREDWESYYGRKIDRKLRQYRDCPLRYEGGEALEAFVTAHRHLLAGRPTTLHHGDYHIGNMRIGEDGRLYIIDFDRFDYGDPWEEFNRIVWCVKESPRFATGMVNGYFGGDVPREFFELLALYIATNTLSSLPWAIPFGEGEVATMRAQAREVLDWYSGMTTAVPSWYL